MTVPSQPHSVGAPATELDDSAGTETLGEHVRVRLEAPRPGSVIGRYVIRDRIGAGGMGEVFAAHDGELDRDVALKLIRERVGRSESDDVTQRECERLRGEAQALARLSHPNVVHVYEVGRHAVGGRMFLAMELVEGPTLSKWRAGSLAELIDVYAQAGRGLAAAHSAGLAHRDFKPGNVLVGSDGRVRVVDFGLATAARPIEEQASTIGDDSDEPRERSGSSSLAGPGTLPYMAPEQAFEGTGGAAADQFSFCVALFEAVYGARPFPAVGVMQLLAKLESCTVEFPTTPPPYGRVPRWLRRLLVRGLSRAPEHRFPSMDELLAELTRDRLRAWRRVGFAAAVSGVTTIVLLALLTPSKPLAPPEPDLDGVWDSERREQLELAFDRVDAAWADGSKPSVLGGIDRWSASWIDVARAARHTRDPLGRRTVDACLASMREQAHATIEALISSEPALLVGAVAAVDALPEPSRCQGDDALGLALIDPELLLPELRSLADAAAQRGLGNFELARASADAVLRTATTQGWTALELAALRQRGLAAIDAGDRPAGLADLTRARELAVRTGDRQTEVELWVDIAWASRKLDDLALRRERLSVAAAHVDALLADDPDRHALLLTARVSLATALDLRDANPDESERLLLAGLDRLESIDAGDSGLAIDHLHALASVRDRTGMFDLAEQDYQAAIARAERARGQAHPANARLWHDAGVLAHERGQLEQARERLGRARELRRAALRIDHPELARSELSLAQLEYVARDYAAAKQHAQWALDTLEQSTGSKDALPEALRFLGQLEARESRWEAAVDYYERALALMPTENLQRSLAELELGKALGALGQDARAIELLDAALPVIAQHQGPERCHQLIRSYERHAESAARSGETNKAIASLEAARACANDPETKARLERELERLR